MQASDVVITMGCGDACPFYPGKRYLDWELDDPAGQDLEAVRPIRDEIRRRVEVLLDELRADSADILAATRGAHAATGRPVANPQPDPAERG